MRAAKFFVLFLGCVLLSACHYTHTDVNATWDMTNEQHDSLNFAITHHYSLNYNFTVISDSLVLAVNPPSDLPSLQLNDSVTVYKNCKIVVADVLKLPHDTSSIFWIKVAHNQETMGWIPETELLSQVVPCDPISQFIHSFSDQHFFALYILLGIAALFYIQRHVQRKRLYMVHFNDIDSFYPTLVCISTASAATLYGSIQMFIPDTWIEFYFYPTVNPFGQPLIMSTFLINVWLMIITGLATIDDTRKQLNRSDAIAYLFGLLCTALVLYIFFSLSVQIYIGYPCFMAYLVFAIRSYVHHNAAPYLCGNCGKPLHHLGKCPYCGALNH